jgi:hypothetical protein
MKNTTNEQTITSTNPQTKTGFLSLTKTRITLRRHHIAPLTINQLSPHELALASHEKEIAAFEIEAELKKASARTYANPTLIK